MVILIEKLWEYHNFWKFVATFVGDFCAVVFISGQESQHLIWALSNVSSLYMDDPLNQTPIFFFGGGALFVFQGVAPKKGLTLTGSLWFSPRGVFGHLLWPPKQPRVGPSVDVYPWWKLDKSTSVSTGCKADRYLIDMSKLKSGTACLLVAIAGAWKGAKKLSVSKTPFIRGELISYPPGF